MRTRSLLLLVVLAAASACGPHRGSVRPEVSVDAELLGDSEEVRFDAAGIAVAGTLTRPPGRGPFLGAVLIAGSGPTDRDWNSPILPGATNGSGRLLAEALTARGVVVLRYDKRGTGATPMSDSLSWDDYMAEVRGALDTLAEVPGVVADRLVVLGHSEGALHALRYAPQDERLGGVGLLMPPGRSLGDLVVAQIGVQLARMGRTASQVEHGELELQAALERFAAGEAFDPTEASAEPLVRQVLASLVQPAAMPFLRAVLVWDPADAIVDTRAPLFLLGGEKDLQVSADDDVRFLADVAEAAGREVTLAIAPECDHVLKHEARPVPLLRLVGGAVALQYNAEGRDLDAVALAAIVDWLRDLSRRRPRPAGTRAPPTP